jgi:hypothetical protein
MTLQLKFKFLPLTSWKFFMNFFADLKLNIQFKNMMKFFLFFKYRGFILFLATFEPALNNDLML